jgi:hypothetical protein
MAFAATPRNGASYSRTGHKLGDFNKKTSIGNGHRKSNSLKGKKRYRGQGKR